MEKILSDIIRDWVIANKRIFWKYEISSFYQTYKIAIANLPNPTKEDISLGKKNKLLTNPIKAQLCNSIKKNYSKTDAPAKTSISVKVDYIKSNVIAVII